MKIVHLLAPAQAGGLERVVQGLAIGQRSRGHQVTVMPVVERPMTGHPFIPPLRRSDVTVREIVVPHRAYGRERHAVATLCTELRADVVHSHGYHTDVVNSGALRAIGIAMVSTHHGSTGGPWLNRLYEYVHWRTLRRFDAVIAVSRVIESQLHQSGVPRDHVHMIPNAWSEIAPPLSRAGARAALGLADDAAVAGWVGRMSREKGVDVFIDAMRLLDASLTACAIGEGAERQREQARAETLLGSRMRWPGMIPEAGRLCQAFDVFVLSSRTEGIPIALLEAIAAGTPVVATAVGGVPDVITPREGWLVPPDDPEALAAAIGHVLSDRSEAGERASRARHRLATKFSRERWLDQHDVVYRSAIDTRRRAKS